MKPALSLLTLGTDDFDAMLSFYGDGLGWKTSYKPGDGVAFFQLSGLVLALWPREELAKDAGTTDDGKGFRGFAMAHNVGAKEEVDATLRQAETAGGRIVKPAHDTFWGGYSGYFADPDGFLWEIAWNPHWTLEEDGRVALPS